MIVFYFFSFVLFFCKHPETGTVRSSESAPEQPGWITGNDLAPICNTQ